MFEGNATQYRAAVFTAVLSSAPRLVISDELIEFRWWSPEVESWDEMDALDAEVVR